MTQFRAVAWIHGNRFVPLRLPQRLHGALISTFMATLAVLLLSAALTQPAEAQVITPNSVQGDLSDITSIDLGLLVRFAGTIKPTNCSQPTTWLLVAQGDQTMVATALSHWMSGGRKVTIYVDPAITGPYCRVVQVAPQP